MRWLRVGAVVAVATVLAGCSETPEDSAQPAAAQETSSPTPSTTPSTTPTPTPTRAIESPTPTPPEEEPPLASDGRPRPAVLDIPAIDVAGLRVVPHQGSPDDATGTDIQNGGVAASPHGPRGGTGVGGIGNYIVTAHRLSSTKAFLRLPELTAGDRVHLVAGGDRYTYEITRTRWTSFRSAKSLAAQSAPVPGRPGREATQAMITLSTCATPEDHAAGNYWSDEFGNPEHRIDKIGVLVAIRPA